MQQAPDATIFDRAAAEDRIIVSADTDFGSLLALRATAKPSVILFRGATNRRPENQSAVLAVNLAALTGILEKGAIVTIEDARIRVRSLPIGES